MPSERLSFTRFCWTTVDEAPSNSTPSTLRAKQLQNAMPFDESRNSIPSLGASTTFRNMTRMFVDIRTSMASLLAEVTVERRSPGRRPSAGHPVRVSAGAMAVVVRWDRRTIETGPEQRPLTVIVAPFGALLMACCRSSKALVDALRAVTVTAQGSSIALPQSLQASCGSAASAGQSSWTPSQLSGVSQGPAAGPPTGRRFGLAGAARGGPGARAGTLLGDVALAGRGAAHGGGGLELVLGAVIVHTVATLVVVAGAGRRPALGRALGVDGAAGARPGAEVVHVARAGRGPAERAARREGVRRTVVLGPITALGPVARARRGAPHRRALLLRRGGGGPARPRP